MIQHKIRQKSTSDKNLVAFLLKYGVEPLRIYTKNGTEYYTYDYRDTQLLKIAYRALGELNNE